MLCAGFSAALFSLWGLLLFTAVYCSSTDSSCRMAADWGNSNFSVFSLFSECPPPKQHLIMQLVFEDCCIPSPTKLWVYTLDVNLRTSLCACVLKAELVCCLQFHCSVSSISFAGVQVANSPSCSGRCVLQLAQDHFSAIPGVMRWKSLQTSSHVPAVCSHSVRCLLTHSEVYMNMCYGGIVHAVFSVSPRSVVYLLSAFANLSPVTSISFVYHVPKLFSRAAFDFRTLGEC